MQTYAPSWVTPKRMKRLTIAAICAAGLVSTVGMSGSTPAPTPASAHVATASAAR